VPPRKDRHQRYHVLVGKRRTTVSLDGGLAALLALRLGEDPGTPSAGRRVRAWLQERTAADSGGAGLNRRLIRHALLEVADKELSARCAAWLDGSAASAERPPRAPRDRAAPPPSAVAAPGNRFVLYRFTPGFPPDIVARESSPDRVLALAGRLYAGDALHPAILRAALITTEKEQRGAYYIRRCSEACWTALAGKRTIRPRPDTEGVWRTRAELARLKKANAWRDAVRFWRERPRRRNG
jgi:hypothetical protein